MLEQTKFATQTSGRLAEKQIPSVSIEIYHKRLTDPVKKKRRHEEVSRDDSGCQSFKGTGTLGDGSKVSIRFPTMPYTLLIIHKILQIHNHSLEKPTPKCTANKTAIQLMMVAGRAQKQCQQTKSSK
jgi:hypothetical protein